MAVLQAARAHSLGMPLDRAKSWGLNRAIFYAAAKRGFIAKERPMSKRGPEAIQKRPIEEKPDVYYLGDEMAHKVKEGGRTYFKIGDEAQTEETFARQIEARFGSRFGDAWNEALSIIKKFDKGTLLSQRAFYDQVYRPRRDELASKWTGLATAIK
jgi:hypothetical protein